MSNGTKRDSVKLNSFITDIGRRVRINQGWDLTLTPAGIFLTFLITVFSGIDLSEKGKSFLGIDSSNVREALVILGATGVVIQTTAAAYPVRRKANSYRELKADAENIKSLYEAQLLDNGEKELNEALSSFRTRRANIESIPELSEIGLRFDILSDRINTLIQDRFDSAVNDQMSSQISLIAKRMLEANMEEEKIISLLKIDQEMLDKIKTMR
ncbi:MAG: hypothetical protein AAGF93_00275 [Cyanobacteria bacterium P01_H01_bin.105]